MSDMDFQKAEDTVVLFGKYVGSTIGDIADQDILYLDWLYGEFESNPPSPADTRSNSVYQALIVFMNDSAVQSEVESAMANREFDEPFSDNDL